MDARRRGEAAAWGSKSGDEKLHARTPRHRHIHPRAYLSPEQIHIHTHTHI